MPQDLVKIFDENLVDPKERHHKLVEHSFDPSGLRDAESTTIGGKCPPVSDEELLARVLEDPSHISASTMEFSRGAFIEATQRGISVQRYTMTSDIEIHAFGSSKTELHNGKYPEKRRMYIGFVNGLCSLFREAEYPKGQRLFGVFATPLTEIPSHADIFVVVRPDKLQKAAIQQVFYDAFNTDNLVAAPLG